jgi:hypothetical protein
LNQFSSGNQIKINQVDSFFPGNHNLLKRPSPVVPFAPKIQNVLDFVYLRIRSIGSGSGSRIDQSNQDLASFAILVVLL